MLELGFKAAMEWLADEFSRHTGIRCVLHCDKQLQWDEERMTVLVRVAQEALENIASHAETCSVAIPIEHSGSDYVLAVYDDGKDFDLEATLEGKLRLLFIRKCVRTIGGTVDMHGKPGQGTRLAVRIPVSYGNPCGDAL